MTSTTPSVGAGIDVERVICSTISFRHLDLRAALDVIRSLGFTTIDLGALPGVCDHVPYELTSAVIEEIGATIATSGLAVWSVNADVGDLNRPVNATEQRIRDNHLDLLVDLATAIDAVAVVLPNGAVDHEPIHGETADLELVAAQLQRYAARLGAHDLELWVEAPHWFRLVCNLDRTEKLLQRLSPAVGVVCDVSHIVASGGSASRYVQIAGNRIRHAHIRDASPGYIHHSLGNGTIDFPSTISALEAVGYAGKLALELETRDITDAERPAATFAAATFLTDVLARVTTDPRGQRPADN